MKVVLISLDALFDQDLPLMRQQPFFGEFLAHASGCTHVRTVYPALTYPAHTTLVTGVDPRQHGIGHNQPHHPELEASMRPWYWDRAQVKVPNLFDAVKEAGGSCASVLWPVTGKTKSIRWNFPEVLALPGENQTWKMLRYGTPLWLLQMELRHRSERVSLREPYLSDYATILLKDVIASHAPDLSAVHLVDLDDMRHHHGVFNRETRKAIQRLDHRAAEIWETMQHTPGMEGAALCLVSDHGQADVRETVSLTRLGLGSLFTVQSNGFGAYLFFRQKEEEAAHLRELTDFLRQHMAELRASAVYSAEDLAAMGAVEGVSLAVEAAPGVVYDDGLPQAKREKATHGFGPGHPAENCLFALRGKGIRAGLLELQTLWPFPAELVRDRTEGARNVYVVEMNMGHIMAQVRQAAWKPDRVFLVNRVDGQLITPTDIGKVMRVIEGRGF